VAQLAPDTVRRISGLDGSPTSGTVVRSSGAREPVHAAGILTSRRKSAWTWTRGAGDAMDLTSPATAITHRGGRRRRRLVGVTGAVVGITVLDLLTAVQATRAKEDLLRAGGAGLTQRRIHGTDGHDDHP
jgi:hypothetical protein